MKDTSQPSITDQTWNPSADESRRQRQFVALMRWTQWVSIPIALAAAAVAYLLEFWQFYSITGIGLALWITGTLARSLTKGGRFVTSVHLYTFVLSLAIGALPLFFSGLVSTIVVLYVVDLLLVGHFLSARAIPVATVYAVALSIASLSLDQQPPLARIPVGHMNLVFTLLMFGGAGWLIFLYGNNLSQALGTARRAADRLQLSQEELLARTSDLEATTTQLSRQQAELERVNLQLESTLGISERRAARLAASVQVSRAVAQTRDLDQLLLQITLAISEHFDYYHVGIFLIDEASRYAVLRASNSPGGQRMLARGHRLMVGATGIVGYVTGTGRPRIATDVGVDAVYFENPDLPETRSEMAVPLRIGMRTIGALDIQSVAELAFDDEDVSILSALADQVAIAIENAQLLRQSQAALQEAQAAQRRFVRQEWERFLGQEPMGKRL